MDIEKIENAISDAYQTSRWTASGSVNYGLIAVASAIIYLADIIKEVMLKEKENE